MRAWLAIGLVLGAVAPVRADIHVMERGETLEHVAQRYGCRVADVLRANGTDNTLVPAGTHVVVPCRGGRSAIAPPPRANRPWRGRLVDGRPLPPGEGYVVRRPQHAFGERHVVAQLRGVIAEVRALHPELHVLAIGDLSAEGGGKLGGHVSHQSGLDVDVGLYYTRVGSSKIDLAATWALILGFARTAHAPDGVEVILFDHDLQRRLYEWAYQRGTPVDQLGELLQYPRGPDVPAGLVRHWPNHADHLHVRWKAR